MTTSNIHTKTNYLKGKKYEEVFGVEKSEKIKASLREFCTGKTFSELYGEEKANEMKNKISKSLTNKLRSKETCENISLGIQKSEKWNTYIKSDVHKRNASKGMKGKIPWNKGLTKENDDRVKKIAESHIGLNASDETKKKLSESHTGLIQSEETREKRRVSFIKHIEKHKNWTRTTIGKHEKQLLDEQEIKDNCKIDRQHPVKKYILDGYCQETNTVYEVYELKHFSSEEQIQKDLKRQQEIEDLLKCKFVIIRDENK
jgi:very-short-patch-repair endonuclease